jgi:hypothetical protein
MTKHNFFLASIVVLFFFISSSCDILEDAAKIVNSTSGSTSGNNAPQLTNEEVVAGLKEALVVGATNSVNLTSITDGFLGNNAIKLPFPEDAIKMKEKAIEWGLDGQVQKFETTLNRAAEEAAKEALPIFKDAITNMSISDGFTILKGGNGAATKYLKDNTTSKLTAAFKPKVDEAISKVKLTEYWDPIMTKYNSAMTFTGGQKINTDLSAYVTEKAINGLFYMVEIEENKIRQDPVARVTDLLTKVFGSIIK